MKKRHGSTAYVCNACGQDYVRWMGRCENCGAWNTVVEVRHCVGGSAGSRVPMASGIFAVKLASCQTAYSCPIATSGCAEFDRVLGGGLPAGAIVLIGGDPGIGKSTLLLQLAARWAERNRRVLYVSGEESIEQIAQRAQRLGLNDADIHLLAETSVNAILAQFEVLKPAIVVIDSIQTLWVDSLESAAGTVAQIRESTALVGRFAKQNGTSVFLIGHVTKEGAIAGPRILEHMVDTVLYFEGDASYQYRMVRSIKNRFGPTGEIALFRMTGRGLEEVDNPSELFLHKRMAPEPGSAIVPVLEGSRVIAVEVQALVNPTHYGMPQRVASGVGPKKLALLLAVLERYGKTVLGNHDVFCNIAGGLTVEEPAIDMGIVAALLSSFLGKPLRPGLALVGEVGLSGELRAVNRLDMRLRELARLGITECMVPPVGAAVASPPAGMRLIVCHRIAEVKEKLFSELRPTERTASARAEYS